MQKRGFLDLIPRAAVFTSALGCAGCFPALGALGAALGMGALSRYEGLFINFLLPLFAAIALLLGVIQWFLHGVFWRGLLSVSGPVIVLLVLYPLWSFAWSTPLFYVALGLMLVASGLELWRPAGGGVCQS